MEQAKVVDFLTDDDRTALSAVATVVPSRPELAFVTFAKAAGKDIALDYRGADLRGYMLRGQDLSSVNLDNADLRGAFLEGATGYRQRGTLVDDGSEIGQATENRHGRDPANMKLMTPENATRERARFGAMLGDIRRGTGYDVHAFGDGDHLIICGVRVPHTRGFLAHSDGDVGLHAIVDAILGALADGDIGSHFPPSDPKWKGASSDRFLKYAVDRVTARGGLIANLEVTLICERPKIGPLRDDMRARIAKITGLDISRVAVKATTSERLGFTGREEGVAATASATIRLPWDDELLPV